MLHMSQICYSIIKHLHIKENHIRSLSKDIGINQMTISRRIKELEDRNIIDFKMEGKNKVYFIKKSVEANEYLFMMEHNKLLDFLKDYPQFRLVIEKIKDDKRIKMALFFGSYVKGTFGSNSDIDIYIDTNNQEIKKQIQLLDSQLSVKIGEFDINNNLIKEIIDNHIVIKGVERYYELIH